MALYYFPLAIHPSFWGFTLTRALWWLGRERRAENGKGRRTSCRGFILLGAVLSRGADGFGIRDVILVLVVLISLMSCDASFSLLGGCGV